LSISSHEKLEPARTVARDWNALSSLTLIVSKTLADPRVGAETLSKICHWRLLPQKESLQLTV
jgi:hypothetical protein